MKLSKLLDCITVSKLFQTGYGRALAVHDTEIHGIQYDSRKIQQGDLFVAIRGNESDGHSFISNAIKNGAKVVVLEDDKIVPDSIFMHSEVVKIVVPNTRIALSQMSNMYFDYPSKKMKMIGVTGTNGKTTTTHLIKSLLELSGNKVGLIGTIEYKIGDTIMPAIHTTPESLELNMILNQMVESGCSTTVMEVSSHSLHQHRVDGIVFNAAVFTNLTQDHLDYHGTLENYFNSKKILFDTLQPNSWAVVNIDDEWGRKISKSTKANILTYGSSIDADLFSKDISLSMEGTKFSVVYKGQDIQIESKLIGRFNVSNILAAFGIGVTMEIPIEIIQKAIYAADTVCGRFEQIKSQQGWTAIIDYAHTPDALEKALKAIHDVFDSSRQCKVITIFGCGGNRDRTKRPLMAKIASQFSDISIITSDNPRNENPETIIDEIMVGMKQGTEIHREVDRKNAIELALRLARKDDVVLIAGKGHENYQIIGNNRFHFNDREVVEEFIRLHS